MTYKYEFAQHKRPIQTLPDNGVCGDQTLVVENDEHILLAIFDGAGHGPSAYNISKQAEKIIKNLAFSFSLEQIIERLHSELTGSIGGVVAICQLEKQSALCTCLGVGNISIKVFPPKPESVMIRGGVLGYEITRPKINHFKLDPGEIIVLMSDGINENFKADEIPDFYSLSANQICCILIDYFSKTLDDASVISLKVHDD